MAYNDTAQANLAVQHAYKMAAAYGASMTIFHVVPDTAVDVAGRGAKATSGPNTSVKEIKNRAKARLEQLKKSLDNPDVKIDTAVAVGKPFREVCKKAQIEGYDVIVMGSRGLGKITGLLGGSVSRKVSRHAPCPVILIHAAS